jgi:hypothetical protein
MADKQETYSAERKEITNLIVEIRTLSTQVKMALAAQKETNGRVDKLIDLLFEKVDDNKDKTETRLDDNKDKTETRLDKNDKKIAWISGFCAVNALAIFAVVIVLVRMFSGKI